MAATAIGEDTGDGPGAIEDSDAAALPAEFPCEKGEVAANNDLLRSAVLTPLVPFAPPVCAAGWPVSAVVCVWFEPSCTTAGESALGKTGLGSVTDAIEPDCAPPVVSATPVRVPGVVDEPAGDDECDPGETFAPDGPLLSSVDEPGEPGEPVEPDELESAGCASATPGIVAIADPTPNTTASAPTRPTQLT